MSSTQENLPLRTRVLNALAEEVQDGAVCSAASESGRYLLLANSPNADKGAELVVEFPDKNATLDRLNLTIEAFSQRVALFEGTWTANIEVDGETLLPTGTWETVCESFEKDYAFFERTIPLTGGRRLSRRLFFAYHEALLLFFDEVAGNPTDRINAPKWNYRAFYPLAKGLELGEDDEAREVVLQRVVENATATTSKKKKEKNPKQSEVDQFLADLYDSDDEDEKKAFENIARVFPLNLCEWKADRASGDMRAIKTPFGLELTAIREGACVASSLLVDLNVKRSTRRCTWRTLAVGESMQRVSEDHAVGRKIQLGQEQYVLYASTSPAPAIRSILSRNLLSDFMFGKFTASRGVDPIVDVEIE